MTSLFDLSFWLILLKSAFFSLGRLLVTYLISLIFSLTIAIWLVSSRKMERIAIPIFDMIQNIPPLAFYPLAILLFVQSGLKEGAAIFVLLSVMLWPLLFNLVGAAHQIPKDIHYAARIFGAKGFKYFWHILLPAIFPTIVTSSIVSWGMGWNLLVIAEWIRYGASQIQLQGLGGLLNQAAYTGQKTDSVLFLITLISILLIVFLIHFFVWRPLLKISKRYKFD